MQVLKQSGEDIFVWADGTWCYRYELESMTHMSDDTTLLVYDSAEWQAFTRSEEE